MQRGAWLAAISSFALAGCNAVGGGCPPLVSYSRAQQADAAHELRALPQDSELAAMIVDYGKLRDACRVSLSG